MYVLRLIINISEFTICHWEMKYGIVVQQLNIIRTFREKNNSNKKGFKNAPAIYSCG